MKTLSKAFIHQLSRMTGWYKLTADGINRKRPLYENYSAPIVMGGLKKRSVIDII